MSWATLWMVAATRGKGSGTLIAGVKMSNVLKEEGERMKGLNDINLELFNDLVAQGHVPTKPANPLEIAEAQIGIYSDIRITLGEFRRKAPAFVTALQKAGRTEKATELNNNLREWEEQALRFLAWTPHFRRQFAAWKETGKWAWEKSFGVPQSRPLAEQVQQWRLESWSTSDSSHHSGSSSSSKSGSSMNTVIFPQGHPELAVLPKTASADTEQGTSSQALKAAKQTERRRRARQRAKEAKASTSTQGSAKGGPGGSNDDNA